jgi:transposase
MPYKFEYKKIPIPKDKDRRRKLTDEQKTEIKALYGKVSQRKLASIYGVSRRTIQFIGDPEKHKENLQRRQERGGSMAYYDKDYNTSRVREHRRYKNKTLKNIEEEKDNG